MPQDIIATYHTNIIGTSTQDVEFIAIVKGNTENFHVYQCDENGKIADGAKSLDIHQDLDLNFDGKSDSVSINDRGELIYVQHGTATELEYLRSEGRLTPIRAVDEFSDSIEIDPNNIASDINQDGRTDYGTKTISEGGMSRPKRYIEQRSYTITPTWERDKPPARP